MPTAGRPREEDRTKLLRKEHPLALEGQELADPATAPPLWLAPLAKEEWGRLLPMLCAQGIAAVDLTLLESYCTAYAQFRTANDTVIAEGQTLEDSKGKRYTHPCIAVARNAAESMRKIGGSLGISAASRSRIKVPPKSAAKRSALEEF